MFRLHRLNLVIPVSSAFFLMRPRVSVTFLKDSFILAMITFCVVCEERPATPSLWVSGSFCDGGGHGEHGIYVREEIDIAGRKGVEQWATNSRESERPAIVNGKGLTFCFRRRNNVEKGRCVVLEGELSMARLTLCDNSTWNQYIDVFKIPLFKMHSRFTR